MPMKEKPIHSMFASAYKDGCEFTVLGPVAAQRLWHESEETAIERAKEILARPGAPDTMLVVKVYAKVSRVAAPVEVTFIPPKKRRRKARRTLGRAMAQKRREKRRG